MNFTAKIVYCCVVIRRGGKRDANEVREPRNMPVPSARAFLNLTETDLT